MQGLTTGGAAIGGLLAGYAADYVGRKAALLVSAVLSMIGWLLLMSANFWTHGGDPVGFILTLLIGRFFTGGALGWGMLCTPVSQYMLHVHVLIMCMIYCSL